eukprot:4683443-Pleurochrysis_carterae.AAC.1
MRTKDAAIESAATSFYAFIVLAQSHLCATSRAKLARGSSLRRHGGVRADDVHRRRPQRQVAHLPRWLRQRHRPSAGRACGPRAESAGEPIGARSRGKRARGYRKSRKKGPWIQEVEGKGP